MEGRSAVIAELRVFWSVLMESVCAPQGFCVYIVADTEEKNRIRATWKA